MGVLALHHSPFERVLAGGTVLEAAGKVSTKPIAARLARFAKAHKAYTAAARRVAAAEIALRHAEEVVAERDVDQDEAVLNLATALTGDGFPRENPFEPFGATAPAALMHVAYAREAKQLKALARGVLGAKAASPRSKDFARTAAATAAAVERAMVSVKTRRQIAAKACAGRDALSQEWETAFAALKRGTRAAEHDGHSGLFDALFKTARSPLE